MLISSRKTITRVSLFSCADFRACAKTSERQDTAAAAGPAFFWEAPGKVQGRPGHSIDVHFRRATMDVERDQLHSQPGTEIAHLNRERRLRIVAGFAGGWPLNTASKHHSCWLLAEPCANSVLPQPHSPIKILGLAKLSFRAEGTPASEEQVCALHGWHGYDSLIAITGAQEAHSEGERRSPAFSELHHLPARCGLTPKLTGHFSKLYWKSPCDPGQQPQGEARLINPEP